MCDRTLSAFERGLLAAVAERSRLAPAPLAAVDRRDETRAERYLTDSRRPVALIVDLGAFEDVRLVAGQLSAERITTDAWGRLRALLRESDELVRIDEDRFGVVLHVTRRQPGSRRGEADCRDARRGARAPTRGPDPAHPASAEPDGARV